MKKEILIADNIDNIYDEICVGGCKNSCVYGK